jgi:hypothetical protein
VKHSTRSPCWSICSLIRGLFTAEADRQGGRARQLPHDLVVADQQRCGVARVDPLLGVRCDVQAHHLRGDEVVGCELLRDGPVRERIDLGPTGRPEP